MVGRDPRARRCSVMSPRCCPVCPTALTDGWHQHFLFRHTTGASGTGAAASRHLGSLCFVLPGVVLDQFRQMLSRVTLVNTRKGNHG